MTSDAQDIPDSHPLRRPRTLSFYVVLFLLVAPFWSLVPLAWLFAFYSLYSCNYQSYGIVRRVLLSVSCCEVGFSIYYLYLARLVARPSPIAVRDFDELRVAFARMLKAGLANPPENEAVTKRPGSPAEAIEHLERHDPRAIDFRNTIRTWFCKAPWSSIKLLEMQKWLYWAMFHTDLPKQEEISESHKAIFAEGIAQLQNRLGCKVDEGSDPNIIPMRLSLDRMGIQWRPFSFYFLICSSNLILRKLYQVYWGVQYSHFDGIEYLLKMPVDWNPEKSPRPIIFLHGLGLGLVHYHPLVSHLFTEFTDRPVLVPLQPQSSHDIFHPDYLNPPGRRLMSQRLANLVQSLGWATIRKPGEPKLSEDDEIGSFRLDDSEKGVTVVSHSNGTYVHAWLLKENPGIISRSCFIDPVTFCSWEGDICYNFFYRPCTTGMELIMRYFVATELGICNLLRKHYCWTSNSLWFEEIPNATDPTKTLFLLGGKDAILNSERVKRYLASHGVRQNLWYDPESRHGAALVNGTRGHAKVMHWLSEYEG